MYEKQFLFCYFYFEHFALYFGKFPIYFPTAVFVVCIKLLYNLKAIAELYIPRFTFCLECFRISIVLYVPISKLGVHHL